MSASASLNYALARGKAVIASDLPEIAGLECVRLFRRGDAEALAAAVREVMGSAERERELAEAARRYAAAHSYGALAQETLRLYQELARGGR
jgi:glycosyltransferase involved in cell wall biosynthesis